MLKKLLIIAVLLFSFLLSFAIGVLNFSRENIDNVFSGAETKEFKENEGMTLLDWEIRDGKYVSGVDSQIVLDGVNARVNNLKINGKLFENIETVEVFYTEREGEEFSAEKCVISLLYLKNNDIYIDFNKDVFNLRIDIFSEPGKQCFIDSVELNPKNLNINFVPFVLILLITVIIGWSLISLIYDRQALKKDVFALKRYKYLLYDFVVKDIKTKYRRSVLGVLWSVLNPLLMMLVLTAVFSNIIRVEVEGGFPLFYLTGYILFNFVSEATSFSLTSITSAAPLIKKVYLPKYIFPLQKGIFSFVNMLFSLLAFVIVFIFFAITGAVKPHLTMLLFPVPMILLFVFTLGLCFALSAMVVFFRDIGHIWGILLTVWMYASPIIYPLTMVPDWLANLIKLNPLYYYIDFFRNVMIYGTLPSMFDFVICVFYAVAMCLLGTVIFRKSQDKFVLYI